MIVRCPSCSSRRDIHIPPTAAGATLVDCADCGHGWLEGLARAAENSLPVPAGTSSLNDKAFGTDQLLEAARTARKEFELRRRARRGHHLAWASLVAFSLCPVVAATAFPEQLVTAIPATINAYAWAGQDVNIYGLDIRQVDLQYLVVEGRKIIAIKGEVSNVSSGVRKIPWLRFGLRAKDGAEVYHWTLDTEVRPLKPGESTSFVTRLASPPEAARNVEIRFARAEEIGSNQTHE